jgi:uncharacterized phage protein (TIGR01671 family)
MREIKFRGKRLDNGIWAYGNCLILEGHCFIVPALTNGSWNKNKLLLEFISPCYAVDPSTICRFTGLLDKGGREIYESDILQDPDGNRFKVVWNEGAASFELINPTQHFLFVQRYIDMFERIGSIHDNLELLEVPK